MNKIILKNLLKNRDYVRKVLPHLKPTYFRDQSEKVIFSIIRKHITEYRSLPTKGELEVVLSKQPNLSEDVFTKCADLITDISAASLDENLSWLYDETEQWAKSQGLANAISKGADLLASGDQGKINSIPELVTEALKISFNTELGIDILDETDIKARHQKYKDKITKYATGITKLDNLFSGGIEPKSVTVFMAGTGVGKSMTKIAIASNLIRQGYDVLYVTLELSEEKVSQRVDANLLRVPINDIADMTDDDYVGEFSKIKKKTMGRMIVKEFPPASINKNHLTTLLDELEIKKNFKPQIVIVDYLNLMLSARYQSENSYTTIKSIIEEIRGIAVEREQAWITSTQGDRSTNSTSTTDFDLTNISESIGTAQTADAVVGLIAPEELAKDGLQKWKILKNRFGDIVNKSFVVGVDYKFASVFDVDDQDIRIVDKAEEKPAKKNYKPVFVEEDEGEPDTGFNLD